MLDRLESEAFTGSVSTQISGSPLPAIAWASSRLTKVLPTPPLPWRTKCSLRGSLFAEEAAAVVRPLGSGRD
jgi:hypothetical protein